MSRARAAVAAGEGGDGSADARSPAGVEGAIYRLKKGIPWRCLPPEFGAWQTVHRRHYRWSVDGPWYRVLARLQAEADARGELD